MKKILIFTCLLLSLSLAGSAYAELLIDLDAADLPIVDGLTSWENDGTVECSFIAAESEPNVIVSMVDGRKAVVFGGGSYMESDVTTPAALTGENPPFTVMVWADPNGTARTGEDTLFQWADRDFGDSCAAFCTAGGLAFTTFTNDVSWTTNPPADQWTHLACTYDGSVLRLYIDGLPDNQVAREYDFKDDNYMRIARQFPDVYGTHPYTGAIASIKVHDVALSQNEIQNDMGEFVAAGDLTPAGLSLFEGNDTGQITLQLRLNNETGLGPDPAEGDLEITFSFAGTYADAALGTSAVGDPYVVTVPVADWDDPITFQITPEDDSLLEATHNVLVQAVITGGDPDYQGAVILPAAGLAVKIVDNDYPPCPDPGLVDGAYIDTFDCSWDYSLGVTGLWDGIVNPGSFDGMDSNVTFPGDLYLNSPGGNWSGADASGPYLYKEIGGDFIAEIKTDPDNWSLLGCGGLMIRLGDPAADGVAGEDNIIVCYWINEWGFDNLLWLTNDNARTEADVLNNNAPYLRVERRGNEFWLSHSSDGENWELFPNGAPYVRDDLDVETLQVGVFQSYGDWAGDQVTYDYFKVIPSRGAISGTLNLTESIGESDTVEFQLDTEGVSAPLADIDVTLSAVVAGGDPNTDPNDIAIGTALKGKPYAFTIPAANYDLPHLIDVAAVIDSDPELDQLLTLSADIASTDPNWNGLFIRSDALINVMEEPGLLIDEGDGVEVTEDLATDTYTVRLKTDPTAEVTVTTTDDADPDQIAAIGPLTFDSTDFITPKIVTVTAIDDGTLETDPHGTTLSLESSNGAEYDALTDSVGVSILENECGAWGYYWADFDEDCDVDIVDLSTMASNWLDCTAPYDPGCVNLL